MTSGLGATTPLVADLLAVLAALSGWRGLRLLRGAFGDADHPEQPVRLVAGLRALIVGAGLAALAGGLALELRWLTLFGVVFLAEELLETSLHLWAARREAAERGAGDEARPGDERGRGEAGG